MKSVVYTGQCKSISVRGKKFTSTIRAHVIPDDEAKYFTPPDFIVTSIEVPAENEYVIKLRDFVALVKAMPAEDYVVETWDSVEIALKVADDLLVEISVPVSRDVESQLEEAYLVLKQAVDSLEEAPSNIPFSDLGVDYNNYNVKELKELCTERGLNFPGNASKSFLINILNDDDQEKLDAQVGLIEDSEETDEDVDKEIKEDDNQEEPVQEE